MTEIRGKFSTLCLFNDSVILSTDGSVQKEAGFATRGRIVRDRDRAWIIGFNRHLED